MGIPKSELPKFVRRCYEAWRTATVDLRAKEVTRLKFYAGDEGQWLPAEVQKRQSQRRPILSINRIKPAVDQVEGDIRSNPPGPKVLPVGDGADKDMADIHAGLIRECEHRSNGQVAYITAARYQATTGYGVIELGTQYTDDNSFNQECVILPVEDPAMWFFDPKARRIDRKDAQWAGKIKMLSRDEYEAEFGKNRAVLKDRTVGAAVGAIQNFIGVPADLAQINEWTQRGRGPFMVVEFYLVETDTDVLRQYTDKINRTDSSLKKTPLPPGVKLDPFGDEREVEVKTIQKYVVDALEVLRGPTQWLGTCIPGIPVLGQEIYIDGKLYRASLISGALDSQRGLNYAATTATELAGLMPKAPFIGWEGQFENPKWESANSEIWAYLEVKPSFAVNPTTGESELLPAPQRNTWETPIQWLLALAAYFSDGIKATTSIFDPSLGAAKGNQSGTAINSLRSESNTGTFFIADNLHHSIQCLYEQIVIINSQILTDTQVKTIVRPDSEHELATLNQEFPDGIDPASGKAAKARWMNQGRFAIAITVGPANDTLKDLTSKILTEFLKIDPAILQVPGVAAKALRSISQGDPEIEGIADLLEPSNPQNPQQLASQVQTLQRQNQGLVLLAQKLQHVIDAKLPQIEADKWKAALDSLTKISVAEINASLDADKTTAQLVAARNEQMVGLSHEVALESHKHEHAMEQGEQQANNQAALAQQQAANEPDEQQGDSAE